MVKEYLLIDGAGKILGRLASQVAKLALLGKNVVVENAKDIVISGDKKLIFKEYVQKKQIKTLTNPRRGPFFWRRPDRLFRRTVRGMLPFKQARGQQAYRRVHACVNEVDRDKYQKLVEYKLDDDVVGVKRLNRKYITLETVGNRFGWQNYVEE